MLVLAGCSGGAPTGRVASHAAVAAFARIPAEVRENARKLSVYFGHTSLGSQLVSGLANLGPGLSLVDLTEDDADLGSSDWHTRTDAHLAAHSQVRVVVWSWCGQQSSNSEAQVQDYLAKMSALEAKYPAVQFVYMTGHLRGAYSEFLYETAENQVLQRNNRLVREYCAAHGKWLFDFADIEAYPDDSVMQCSFEGMPVECTWPETPTFDCAHSRAPNCLRKGKAFFWLLARMTGWDGRY